MVKNQPVNAGDERDAGLIPGSGRSPGGEHGNPLQCSCLENPMDRKAWWATVHRLTENQTELKQLSTQTYLSTADEFLRFCLSEKVFIPPLLSEDNFVAFRIFYW